jgi:hypothetical protein
MGCTSKRIPSPFYCSACRDQRRKKKQRLYVAKQRSKTKKAKLPPLPPKPPKPARGKHERCAGQSKQRFMLDAQQLGYKPPSSCTIADLKRMIGAGKMEFSGSLAAKLANPHASEEDIKEANRERKYVESGRQYCVVKERKRKGAAVGGGERKRRKAEAGEAVGVEEVAEEGGEEEEEYDEFRIPEGLALEEGSESASCSSSGSSSSASATPSEGGEQDFVRRGKRRRGQGAKKKQRKGGRWATRRV